MRRCFRFLTNRVEPMRSSRGIVAVALFVLGFSMIADAQQTSQTGDRVGALSAEFDFNRVQPQPPPAAVEPVDGGVTIMSTADQLVHEHRMTKEKHKLYEAVLLVGFALIALPILLWFLTTRTIYSADHVVNASGLVLIVFGTLLLVILADVDEQLTAAIGILGAVAGYLFGTMKAPSGRDQQITGKAVRRVLNAQQSGQEGDREA